MVDTRMAERRVYLIFPDTAWRGGRLPHPQAASPTGRTGFDFGTALIGGSRFRRRFVNAEGAIQVFEDHLHVALGRPLLAHHHLLGPQAHLLRIRQ